MRPFAFAFIGGIVGTVFTSMIVIAWTGPTSVPPHGNVSPPLNVGTVDQVKNAGLALNSLAVFGNQILAGTSRYLNFGAIAGVDGYGFRDNNGAMEFKNNAGSWSTIAASGAGRFGSTLTLSSGMNYTAGADGLLFVRVVADGTYRAPSAGINVNGSIVTTVTAQNSWYADMPSIGTNSATYPIHKSSAYRVDIANTVSSNVLIEFTPYQ
jgi:hypothetical protein